MTPHEARAFLVERIAAQAERDGAPLSEAERQTLDSGAGSIPAELGRKLRGVIRRARSSVEEEDSGGDWEKAVEILRWEDPALPRLIDLAGKPVSAEEFVRMVLIAAAIAAAVAIVAAGVFRGGLR
jgi:hypothetical protein